MKKAIKHICTFLALAIISGAFTVAFAVTPLTITASNVVTSAGETVDITLTMANNPGVVSLLISVGYDNSVLTLTNVTDGGIICKANNAPTLTANPYKLAWEDDTALDDYTGNGTLTTLTFTVANNAPDGVYPITLTSNPGDAYNVDIIDVDFTLVSGSITIGAESENGFVASDGVLQYLINGEPTYAGVVEYEGNYYYINSTRESVRNRTGYYVTKTNDIVPVGYYDFDANGVMTPSTGTEIGTNLKVDPDGEIRYYDGEAAVYQGVVADSEGNLYYVNSTKKAVKDTTYFITKTNDLIPTGSYVIGADGKINVEYLDAAKKLVKDSNGDIVYFDEGAAQYAGVVQAADGSYYYINSTKKAVRNATYFVTKTNGLIPAAEYTIGADGKIELN